MVHLKMHELLLTALALWTQTCLAAPRAIVPKAGIEIGIAPERNLLLQKSSQDAIYIEGLGRSEVRKFLMVTNGPEAVSLRYNTGAAFLGDIGDDLLFIKDSPFSNPQTYEERRKHYRTQSELVWECLRFRIKDLSGGPLVIPARQLNCKVERLDEKSAVASGGLCFFGIGMGTQFQITYEPNPACVNPSHLSRRGISPTDFGIFSGYYIAGDASGMSLDLMPLEATRIRLALEPWHGVLPLSTNLGETEMRWPSQLGLDAHLGLVRAFWSDDGTPMIETPLLVSNRCPSECRNGACASRCDFTGALGAQVTLSRLEGGRATWLDFWQMGGTIPPRWEGMLPSQRTLPFAGALEVGKRYRLEMDLGFPDTYYRMFRGSFSQFLISLDKFNSTYTGAGMSELPGMRGMPSLANAFPGLPVMGGLGSSNPGQLSVSVASALDGLKRLVKYDTWPPYYEGWCASGRCSSILGREAQLTLSLDFTVLEGGPGREGRLGDFVVRRRSSFLGNYERRVAELPSIESRPPEDLFGE